MLCAELMLVALVWPMMFFLSFGPQLDGDPSSLGMMSWLPGVHVLGPAPVRELAHDGIGNIFAQWSWSWGDFLFIACLVASVIGALSLCHLLYWLVRERPSEGSHVHVGL